MSAFTEFNGPSPSGATVGQLTQLLEAVSRLQSTLNAHIQCNVDNPTGEVGSGYVHGVHPKFEDYYDKNAVDDLLDAHYTKAESDSKFATLSGVYEKSSTYTKTEVDAKFTDYTDTAILSGTYAKKSDITAVDSDIDDINAQLSLIGTNLNEGVYKLDNLTTIDKSNIVNAINEIKHDIDLIDNNTDLLQTKNTLTFIQWKLFNSNTYIDGQNVGIGYVLGMLDELASVPNNYSTDPATNATKRAMSAIAFIKYNNTKPLDAIVTITGTEDHDGNFHASLIVQASKKSTDWEDLKFKVVECTADDTASHYYLVVESSEINNVSNLNFRIAGINFIAPNTTDKYKAPNGNATVLVEKTLGAGESVITLSGYNLGDISFDSIKCNTYLSFNGNAIADYIPEDGAIDFKSNTLFETYPTVKIDAGTPNEHTERVLTLSDSTASVLSVPVGGIIRWGASHNPGEVPTLPAEVAAKYEWCNGTIVNRTDYLELASAYGISSEQFALPVEDNSLVRVRS